MYITWPEVIAAIAAISLTVYQWVDMCNVDGVCFGGLW
jgi:hypothetical protein